MATRRQIAANRRNAKKSTGPRTTAGKFRSRRNALRHGLTGETVIDVFESASAYQAFERRMIREYRPRSAIEQELVARLSSLLWRLRRATAIETGLFSIQGRILNERKTERDRQDQARMGSKMRLYAMLGLAPNNNGACEFIRLDQNHAIPNEVAANEGKAPGNLDVSNFAHKRKPTAKVPAALTIAGPETLAQCFLRVARLDNQILERISRYEIAIWRQAAQTIIALHALRNSAPSSAPSSAISGKPH